MTFLPIVERELRLASRRKGTFRMRSWTALIAILVTFAFLTVAFLGGGGAAIGEVLFKILSTYTAGLCLLTALFLTADSISEEKREGTLGLLFLTDLRGYDVVLGKFIARSLNAFYGLMALLPILAISLLFGGLTGVEFWRTALAMINALFVSLTIGVWVSSLCRDSRAAVSGSFAALLFLFGVLPGIGALLRFFKLPSAWFLATWISPSHPFYFAFENNYVGQAGIYWGSLLGSHFLGWFLLGSASWIVTRSWQHRSTVAEQPGWISRLFRLDVSGTTRKARRDIRSLEQNPVLWLIGEERLTKALVWSIVSFWALAVLFGSLVGISGPEWVYHGAKGCAFLFKIVIAQQVCRFFVEARRNGMLELLLCTPLRTTEILRGQWLALQRIFLWPMLAFIGVSFLPIAFLIYRNLGGQGVSQFLAELFGLGTGFVALTGFALYFVADIYAICWFGTWLALTAKKPALAPIWTIIFVVILPLPLCFLDIIADLFFILWGVIKLQQDFRVLLAQEYQPRGRGFPGGKPPVIGTFGQAPVNSVNP